MPKLPRGLTVEYLERILQRRRAELSTLMKERDRIQRQLGALDNQIRDLSGGSSPTQGTTPGGRARNSASLVETLTQVIGKSQEPMGISEILEGVLSSGYRSSAANFRGMINQTLIKERKRFANVARGTYTLKK
jgi:hypothetical protein